MKIREFVIFFILNSILFFGLTRPDSYRGFMSHTDCSLIELAQPSLVSAFKGDPKDFNNLYNYLKYTMIDGRFFPFLDIIRYVEAPVFRLNAYYYHISVYLIGVFSTLFFFALLRLIGVSMLVAYLVSFTFQAGAYAEIWYGIAEGETWGAFFLLLSLVVFAMSIVKKKRFIGMGTTLILLACLCKETFVFTIPFVILYFILFYACKNNLDFLIATKQTRKTWIALVIVMMITLIMIGIPIFFSHIYYHYGYPASRLKNGFVNLISILKPCLFLFPILILFKSGWKGINKYMIATAVITFGWVMMQLIVHRDFTMLVSRYLIPAAIAPFILLALTLDYFNTRNWKKYYLLVTGIYLIMLGYRFYTVRRDSSLLAQDTNSYNQMLDFLADNHIQSVGISGVPLGSWEFMKTTTYLLKARNMDVNFFFIPQPNTTVDPTYSETNAALLPEIQLRYKIIPLQDASKLKSEWIIFLSGKPDDLHLIPVYSYNYEGTFPRFNYKNFSIEQVRRPFFTLIKT